MRSPQDSPRASAAIKARDPTTKDLIRLAASRQSTFTKGEGYGHAEQRHGRSVRFDKSGFAGEGHMLTLYEPKCEDLWFRQMMLADEETMSYNHAWGGTIAWPQEEWASWHAYWVIDHEGKRYYRYLKDEDGKYVGEIAYHYDAGTGHEMANVIIHAPHRRKGYGGEALDLLCAAAKDNGVAALYDDIAIDNPAIRLFLSHGFTEESRTKEKIYLQKRL